MGQTYSQLTSDERHRIAALRAAGYSLRQIATDMDRAPSTISRELKRNAAANERYRPDYAQQLYRARRWTGSKLERDAELRSAVLGALTAGWSPEQVARRLTRKSKRYSISHETIYRFIYAQMARKKDYSWRHYLPRKKSKRGWRGRRGGNPASFIKRRISIDKRPKIIARRNQAGHWEADLMLFSKYGQAILTAQERTSRLLLMSRQDNKAADPVAKQLITWLAPMPKPLRRTMTFDNGTEFARHYHLIDKLGMQTYFCNTHSPWQKGGIENAIGRMRRWLPRKTDIAKLNQSEIDILISIYNNTPRKCLDDQTPAEVFLKHMLHFKCESTSPRAWE